jgi:hypothetical protein
MNDTASAATLSQLLNQFSVPMFAVERNGPYSTFRFACLNDAMAATGDSPAAEVIGKSAFDILPMQEAEIANGRYLECALTRSVVRFRDRFTTKGRKVIWDTTLQFVALPNNAERVLGTSIEIPSEDSALPDAVTFEDIQYISTMADFQLQNLVTLFDSYGGHDLFQFEATPRIEKLSGMCRSIQRAVADIRKIVHSAQSQRQPGCHASTAKEAHQISSNVVCSDTVKALVEYSSSFDGFRRSG